MDTNGLFALADGEFTLEPILREAAEVALPVIVLGEFRYGVRQSRDRQRYEQWLTESLGNFRILDVDETTAASYATVRMELKKAGTPIPSIERRLDRSLVPPAFSVSSEPRPALRSSGGDSPHRLVIAGSGGNRTGLWLRST